MEAAKKWSPDPRAIAPNHSTWLQRSVERHAGELAELRCDEQGNARRLILLHGDDIRYCEKWKNWIVWDSSKWAEDTLAVEQLAADVQDLLLLEAAASFGDRKGDLIKWATACGTARSVRETLYLTRSHLTITPGDLDQHPHLLNFLNGTLDLQTRQFRNPWRSDYLTKQVPHDYDDVLANAPHWEQFIREVTRGDEELAGYLRRAMGSALLGRVRDHKLFIGIGPGGTGKGTFARAIQNAIGPDYSMEAPPGLLLKRSRDAHLTRFADFKGMRLVFSQEIGQGKQLDEELLKRLTGGDRIRANRMNQNLFEFTPTHSLFAFANHLPRIQGGDRGLWRRITVIPFLNLVPAAQMDLDLDLKLSNEAEGILRWLVEGCTEYLRDGLGTCRAVEEATGEYQRDCDALGQFIEEQCVLLPRARVKSSALLKAFNTWAAENGRTSLDGPALGEAIRERGFETKRSNGIHYLGLGLEAE